MLDDPDNPGTEPLDEFNLTVRQRRFCDAFLEILGDPSVKSPKREAALRAGYAESAASAHAYRCMANPNVQAYIGKALSVTRARVGIDRGYVLFKAVVLTEMSEAQGNLQMMHRGLELIGRHTDVGAFGDALDPAAAGDSASFMRALEGLSRDDLLALAGLLAKMGLAGPSDERSGAGSRPN